MLVVKLDNSKVAVDGQSKKAYFNCDPKSSETHLIGDSPFVQMACILTGTLQSSALWVFLSWGLLSPTIVPISNHHALFVAIGNHQAPFVAIGNHHVSHSEAH